MKAEAVGGDHWTIWVGATKEPGTGRVYSSAIWRNPFKVSDHGHAGSLNMYFGRMLTDPARCYRASKILRGQRLGCECGRAPHCSAGVLAELANGRSIGEVYHEWKAAGLLSETREIFEEAR